jgi:hypothetical protein
MIGPSAMPDTSHSYACLNDHERDYVNDVNDANDANDANDTNDTNDTNGISKECAIVKATCDATATGSAFRNSELFTPCDGAREVERS